MKPFLSFRGSRAGFFSDLFIGDSCPLRIPFDRLRAAVSPIPKSRKELHPPASHCKKPIVFFWDDGNCHVLQRSRRIFISHGTTIGAGVTRLRRKPRACPPELWRACPPDVWRVPPKNVEVALDCEWGSTIRCLERILRATNWRERRLKGPLTGGSEVSSYLLRPFRFYPGGRDRFLPALLPFQNGTGPFLCF